MDHQAPVTLLSTSDTWSPSRASFRTPVHALGFAGCPQGVMHRIVLPWFPENKNGEVNSLAIWLCSRQHAKCCTCVISAERHRGWGAGPQEGPAHSCVGREVRTRAQLTEQSHRVYSGFQAGSAPECWVALGSLCTLSKKATIWYTRNTDVGVQGTK